MDYQFSVTEEVVEIEDQIDTILNPDRCSDSQEMLLDKLGTAFEKKHGRFKSPMIGTLKKFLSRSSRFELKTVTHKHDTMVVQVPNNANAQKTKIESVRTSASTRPTQCTEEPKPIIATHANRSTHAHVRKPSPQYPTSLDIQTTRPADVSDNDDIELDSEISALNSKSNPITIETNDDHWNVVLPGRPSCTPCSPPDSVVSMFTSSTLRTPPPSPFVPVPLGTFELLTDSPPGRDDISRLLQRAPSNTLTFKASAYDNVDSFMTDIVSMWNTPYRGDAFIVIGVDTRRQSRDLIGLPKTEMKDNSYHQAMFDDTLFNYRPDFIYEEKDHEEKVYGLFTIRTSRGRKLPCICEILLTAKQSELQHGQIWFRQLSTNTIATKVNLAEIYEWFEEGSGNLQEASETLPTMTDAATDTGDREEALPLARFLKATDNFNKGRAYCLVTNCQEKAKSLHAIGLLPWLKVVDFDVKSGSTGVLSACKAIISKRRSFYMSTWTEEVRPLSHAGTEWFFPRGYVDKQESLCDEDDRKWIRQTSKKIEGHCQDLVEYCLARTPLTVVVLWYCQPGQINFLHRFLSKLEENMGSDMNAVLCYNRISRDEESIVTTIEKVMRMEIIEALPLQEICSTLERMFSSERSQNSICEQKSEYQLPTYDHSNNPAISAVDAAWLKTDLDVLFLNDPHTSGDIDDNQLGQEFYRGGRLSWYEISTYRYDVHRKVEQSIVECIDRHIREAKTAVIILKHAPSSGGSTLAERVLWETHLCSKAPCVRVNSIDHLGDTVARVRFITENTHLPIVLLCDGFETTHLRNFLRMLERIVVIVIHVERQVCRLDRNPGRNSFQLEGKVTKEESPHMAVAFMNATQGVSQKDQIFALHKHVQEGRTHCLYEFGIAAHAQQYRGVQKYVNAYLEIQPGIDLQPWQRIVVYLALVSYYGHMSVPARFFTSIGLIGKAPHDKLNHRAMQFVIEEVEAGILKWRITHHVVANEILEQALSRKVEERSGNENLSLAARKQLVKLVCEFLDDASKVKLPNRDVAPPDIMKIMTVTLIYRDSRNIDPVHGREYHRVRKEKLPPVIKDIPSQPPYTERLTVLRKFTNCFPADPSGWAHLGRFYGLCRPYEEQTARECLEQAIKLRKQEIEQEKMKLSRQNSENQTEEDVYFSKDKLRPDGTLTKIHHMYGIFECRKVMIDSGQDGMTTFGFTKDDMKNPQSKFHDKVDELISSCTCAIDHFVLCRQYVAQGFEETYGYVGEISVRLHLVEFVKKHYEPGGYTGYVSCGSASTKYRAYLSECFAECNRLISECYELVPHDYLGEEFYKVVNLFNVLFMGVEKALSNWQGESTLTSRRCKIAAYKMKHHRKDSKRAYQFDSVHHVHSKEDVEKIVTLHEENIREISEQSIPTNVDSDMLEWLQAIRHDDFSKNYKVEEVLQYVRMWVDVRVSILATYYRFVLNTMLGLGNGTTPGSIRNFADAVKSQPELKRSSFLSCKPRLPREWLGVNDAKRGMTGIKRLVHRRKIMQTVSHSSKPHSELPEVQATLEPRRGTISSARKPLVGYIDIDHGFGSKTPTLKVFFIPKLTEFDGRRFHGTRVEFHIAFTMAHGLEAYNIRELKKRTCDRCARKYEMSALGGRFLYCKCGHVVRRDDSGSQHNLTY